MAIIKSSSKILFRILQNRVKFLIWHDVNVKMRMTQIVPGVKFWANKNWPYGAFNNPRRWTMDFQISRFTKVEYLLGHPFKETPRFFIGKPRRPLKSDLLQQVSQKHSPPSSFTSCLFGLSIILTSVCRCSTNAKSSEFDRQKDELEISRRIN